MRLAVTVRNRDGFTITASSWRAWRETAHLHMRRQCVGCDGEGAQLWMILGDTYRETRWYPTTCNRCKGKGWLLP